MQADKVIDAAGKYVLPGCIDPHTHLDMPFGGTVTIDDVESGQTSAAFGGTTCHVDFIIQGKGQTFAQALDDWRAKANGKQMIDMGYHMAVTDLEDGGTLEELATLPDQGITSYKLFMAYKGALMVDDETLFRTMEVAAKTGALVMVHAENGDVIDVLVQAGARGRAHGAALPRAHAAAGGGGRGDEPRDPARASRRRAAVRRARDVQGGGRADRAAREKGWDVWGETCTQYFFNSRSTTSRSRTSKARSTCTRRRCATSRTRTCSGTPCAPTRCRSISTDHCAFLLRRAEDARQGRLLEDPERRPRPREPAADDPRVRRAHGPDLAQPDGRAARDEPGEALRPLSAQGHGRGRLRRRPRRLRPGEEGDDLRGDAALEGRTTTSTRGRR